MGNEEESRRSGEMDAIEKGGEKVGIKKPNTQPSADNNKQKEDRK